MSSNELDLVYLLRDKIKKSKGFGGKNRFLGDYKTLKVIRKSERTKENSNESGVAI